MSLEAALEKLTAAVEANTAALGKIAGAAKASTAAGTTKTEKPATTKTEKPKTDDDMRAAFGGYLSTGDASDKPARKANIQAILGNYGVNLVTEIASDKRDAALADLKTFQGGGKPAWAAAEGGGEDEDDMLG